MADHDDRLGWGRVFPAARLSRELRARRGAWYPVLSEGRSRVVLDVFGRRLDMPKAAVELRPAAPEKFTVVYRRADEPIPPRGQAGDLGRVYAVCPKCTLRIRLYGEPQELECTGCRHRGVIAWWETG